MEVLPKKKKGRMEVEVILLFVILLIRGLASLSDSIANLRTSAGKQFFVDGST